jgi:hypothetical protein
MVRAAVANISKKEVEEQRKDEEFVQKNRLKLEIYARNPV